VQLLCIPAATLLKLDMSPYLYPLAGVLFQSGWICGSWALLRAAGCDRRLAMQICLALIPSGFLFVNTVFIWPKLSAAGFSLGAFALLVPAGRKTVGIGALAGVCAALAMLSHGGAVFFLVPAIGLVALPPRWPGLKPALTAAIVVGLLYSPWIWYQKSFEPPGDRLVKMHLAGIDGIDPRKPSVVIKEAYQQAGWQRVIDNKLSNFQMLIAAPSLPVLFKFDRSSIESKRTDVFFHTFRSLELLNLGWLAMPILLLQKKWRRHWLIATGLCFASLIFWCLIMFGPKTTVIHQGPYATQILLMVICAVSLAFLNRKLFAVIAVANAILFLADFVPVTDPTLLDSRGALDYVAIALLVLASMLGLFLAFGGRRTAVLFDDPIATSH
jgi:hypothetical protein